MTISHCIARLLLTSSTTQGTPFLRQPSAYLLTRCLRRYREGGREKLSATIAFFLCRLIMATRKENGNFPLARLDYVIIDLHC